ncbi:conserved membrane hypothetical protein [Vibrio chagasii]|nr:conserved membrane hypothetical protein [Vibrio chagasii]
MIIYIIWLVYISELFVGINQSISTLFKLSVLALILIEIFRKKRLPNVTLIFIPFLVLCIPPFYMSFSKEAAITEFIRYLNPLLIIILCYLYKEKYLKVGNTIYYIAITNNLYMIYAYIAFHVGLPTFLQPWYDSGLFIRAYGWIGEVAIFAYLNLCCFIMSFLKEFSRFIKYRPLFFIFVLLSFSYKAFPMLLIALVFFYYKRKFFIPTIVIISCALIYLNLDLIVSIISLGKEKVDYYILVGNSARYESYRVMFESLLNGNLVGEGIGSFGGPSSTIFDSPVYEKYYFDWYGLSGLLKTTDTFYPHVFVELGLIGGIAYFLALIYPIFKLFKSSKRDKRESICFLLVVFSLFLDALWSFNLTSFSYILPCFAFVIGGLSFEEKNI